MKRLFHTAAILLSIIISLSSCEFKEYRPFDNAISASIAKDNLVKEKEEMDLRNKERIDSFKQEVAKRDSINTLKH